MNPDIRISISFKGHRKRRKLKALLGSDATDYLLDLWIGAAVSRPEGVLRGYSLLDIALEAGWEGDPEEFVGKLVQVGFLDVLEDGTYALHDWEEHQPFVVQSKARSERAKKAIRARWRKSTQVKKPVEQTVDTPRIPAKESGSSSNKQPEPAEKSPDLLHEYAENTSSILPENSPNSAPIQNEYGSNSTRIRSEYGENTPSISPEFAENTQAVPGEFSEDTERNTPYRTIPYQPLICKLSGGYIHSASEDAVDDRGISQPEGSDCGDRKQPTPAVEVEPVFDEAAAPQKPSDPQPHLSSPQSDPHPNSSPDNDEQSRQVEGDVLPDAASSATTSGPSCGRDVGEASFYFSRRKRKLTGWKLETFSQFWAAFNYKKGKAEAADAWLDIAGLSPELTARITLAAKKEAAARSALIAKGGSPKWAQGWLSARRWEDWEENGADMDNQGRASEVCNREEKHDTKERQSDREEQSEYFRSIRDAVKRFL